MKEEGHIFTEDNVKILDMDSSRWLYRRIKEAYNIATKELDLNQDQRRHHLPTDYIRVSSSHVSAIRKSRDKVFTARRNIKVSQFLLRVLFKFHF